ncbi:EpsG family protein [Hwangdonia lutea]|uniref:EpsG family protein n=1 Tax=Hwangdonia lutea TaxID=3075823 RepID=A0AA97HR26_9FLAO|nr:EpsG family protein [Hwangdonia sp. SCSIO 19198]WOD43363.1 EpsG family protein [Hwangdonia sp. SCSIO 19198]
MLFVCIITFFHTLVLKPIEPKTFSFNRNAALFLLITLLIYIGFRPIHGIFIDMTTYAHIFKRYLNGTYVIDSDYGFSYFLLFCTKTMTLEMFFFVCACVYIIPLYIASRNWFPKHYFFAFLLFVGSFSFWAYGVNGIRNGMATSLFVLAMSYYKKNTSLMVLFFFLSYSFHTSMLLPIAAFCCTFFVTDTKKYYFFYILSIALSVSMGGIWENIFASIGFGDDRFSTYLTSANSSTSKFASTGFRYDFLIYSAAPIILSRYYKYVSGYKSAIYDHVLHTYIIANGFWIMIIRANFSNRFAYLSWFLMAVVVIYPLLDKNIWTNQFKKIGYVILIYYAFTYGMFMYYAFK